LFGCSDHSSLAEDWLHAPVEPTPIRRAAARGFDCALQQSENKGPRMNMPLVLSQEAKTQEAKISDYAAKIERLLPAIEAAAEESESTTHLNDAIVAQLRDAGLYSLLLPAELGGAELPHVEAMRLIERVAWAHGSTGWCVVVNNALATLMALFISDDGAQQIFGQRPDVTVSGNGVPRGYARPVEGGFMIKGQWAYGSGIEHAEWIHSGCFVTTEGGEVVKLANGQPRMIIAHHPRATIDLKGNWEVLGLRGTGSYDYVLKDVEELFVPETLCYGFEAEETKRGNLQGSLGLVGYTAWGHTTFILGVTRRMLDELVKVARSRTDAFGLMMDSATFKFEFARTEAKYRAARAFVYESWTSIADSFAAGEHASLDQLTMIKLALRHTHDVASDVATFCHRAARGASLRKGVLQMCYRDIHAGTQHILMADEVVQECGRALLGGSGANAKWGVFGIDG
jgi:indole-3-acetate monooxygenase